MQNKLKKILAKSKPIIGLDIGKSEIKMVLLDGSDIDHVIFKSYATQSLLIEKEKKLGPNGQPMSENSHNNNMNAETMSVDPAAEEFERLANAIKKCWKKLDTNVKDVAIAIASNAIVPRKTIMANFETVQELEEAVSSEISSTMPFSIDEVNVDFQVLGPSDSSPTESDVIIWVARKEKIEDTVAVVEAAGLNPQVLDIEYYTIFNALQLIQDKLHASNQLPIPTKPAKISNPFKQSTSLHAKTQSANIGNKTDKKSLTSGADTDVEENISIICDLAYTHTKMLVFKNTDLIYSRENDESIANLNRMMMNRLAIESVSEVERAKKNQVLPIEYQLEVLPQFLDAYAQDIARGLVYFFNSNASNPRAVRGIYLTGGGAALDGLVGVLKKSIDEEILKDKVYLLSIPHYLQKNEKLALGVLQKDEFSLTVACGLALRKFLKK